jgi:RHS repeat-associated protein
VKTNYWYDNDTLDRLHGVIYDTKGFGDTENPISPTSDVSFLYEANGDVRRLSRVTFSPALPGIETSYNKRREYYYYDLEGRRSWKQLFIEKEEDEPMGPLVTEYGYDSLNRLTDVTYPQQHGTPRTTRKVVHHDYGLAGQVRRLTVDGADHASQITYNAAGQLGSLRVGPAGPNQVIETYGYDPATGLLDHQQVQREGVSRAARPTTEPLLPASLLSAPRPRLLDLSYGYQRVGVSSDLRTGQLTRITDNLDPQISRSYSYDALGRLVKAMGGSDPLAPLWTQEYSYDPSGNRTSVKAIGKTRDGTPVPPDGLAQVTYDGSTNRITTPGFAYDKAGNQTRVQGADGSWQRLQYDAAGRLVKVSDDTGLVMEEYLYGAGRQRLMTRSRDETLDVMNAPTFYVWSGDSVIAEYTEEKVQWSGREIAAFRWRKDYVYLGGRLLSTSTPGEAREVVLYHHPDRLGTRLISGDLNTAVIGQLALPFGMALEEYSRGATNRYFTSYDRSAATGLDYAVNRFYDSQQGRFTQTDPLDLAGITLDDPQSHNAYSYVQNDPVNFIDPLGLVSCSYVARQYRTSELPSCYTDSNGQVTCWQPVEPEGNGPVCEPDEPFGAGPISSPGAGGSSPGAGGVPPGWGGRGVLGVSEEASEEWERVYSWGHGGEYVESAALLSMLAWSFSFGLGGACSWTSLHHRSSFSCPTSSKNVILKRGGFYPVTQVSR